MVQNTVGLWQTAAILVGSSADAVISPSLNAGRAYVRVLDPAFVDAMVRPAMATLAPTGSPTIPGFGKVTQVITTTYFHNQLGWLTFPNGAPAGYFTPYAWSISLASWIATDGQNLWNSDYGRIEPSESPMLIRTSALGDTYLGNFGRWVYSTRCGWVHSMKTGRPDYFWSNTLGLLYADNLGGIYSFALSRWI